MEPDTPTATLASTDTTTSATATDRVKTQMSGTIHGDTVDAFRIIAGSTFPIDGDALVRFAPGTEDDATDFNVGVTPDAMDLGYFDATDVFIRGVITGFNPNSNVNIPTTQVVYQVPYPTRHAFQSIKYDSKESAAEYHEGNDINSWIVDDEWTNTVVTKLFDNDVAITMHLSTLRELYDAHPEHTVGDSGAYIITDDALVDPDYYETDDPQPEAGHGKGGNPHTIEYYLEQGECPVPTCNCEFDRFRELRSHIGGKVAHNPDDDSHHDINLRLHEVTVAAESES